MSEYCLPWYPGMPLIIFVFVNLHWLHKYFVNKMAHLAKLSSGIEQIQVSPTYLLTPTRQSIKLWYEMVTNCVAAPKSSSLTSFAARFPSSFRFLSITLFLSIACLSSALALQPIGPVLSVKFPNFSHSQTASPLTDPRSGWKIFHTRTRRKQKAIVA